MESDSNLASGRDVGTANEIDQNSVPVTFSFKNPFKDYIANITMKNMNKTDVRRFRLQVTSYPKPVKAILEMTASARELVVQEIPIVNNSEQDWRMKI